MSALDYCFSTLGCSELNLHETADLAKRHSISTVELRALSGSVDVVSALDAEFGSPSQFAAFLQQRDLNVVALNTSIRLFESRDLSAVEPFIAWSEAAGVAHIRIFDGGKQFTTDEMTRAGTLLEQWQVERRSRGLNVDLMIETHDALADAAQLATFVRRMPDALILWDTHHTWAKGCDLRSLWRDIADNVVHLHVKDSKVGSDGRRHYVLPGQGDFPMVELISLIRSNDRPIPLSLEWERHWHPALPPLDDALTAARTWWR